MLCTLPSLSEPGADALVLIGFSQRFVCVKGADKQFLSGKGSSSDNYTLANYGAAQHDVLCGI